MTEEYLLAGTIVKVGDLIANLQWLELGGENYDYSRDIQDLRDLAAGLEERYGKLRATRN